MSRDLPASGLLVLAVLLGNDPATAQRAISQSDRPGETDAPTIIPRDAIQFEGGIRFERKTEGEDVDTLTVPELTLRIGVAEWLELRAQMDGFLYELRDGASNRALASDFQIGAKLGGIRQRGLWPELGALVGVSMPVGSRAATSDGFDPLLDGLYQWQLGEETALVVNTRFSAPTQGSDDPRRVFQFEPQVSLEWQATPAIGLYVEYFGALRTAGVDAEHSLDGGVTWLLARRRIQLDLSGGGGVDGDAPDWFVAAGVTLRFDAPWKP